MRYQNGDRVILLENMSFKGGGKGNPIASAEIIGFNKITEQYTIKYEVFNSGETGQIDVPEERLTSDADPQKQRFDVGQHNGRE